MNLRPQNKELVLATDPTYFPLMSVLTEEPWIWAPTQDPKHQTYLALADTVGQSQIHLSSKRRPSTENLQGHE